MKQGSQTTGGRAEGANVRQKPVPCTPAPPLAELDPGRVQGPEARAPGPRLSTCQGPAHSLACRRGQRPRQESPA